MNWIQHFEQMTIDKILCLRKNNCWTTSVLLGKKIIIIIELFVKLKTQGFGIGFKEKRG
jgi:hypothetical protein